MTAIDLTLRLWLGAMLCVIASHCGTAKAQQVTPAISPVGDMNDDRPGNTDRAWES